MEEIIGNRELCAAEEFSVFRQNGRCDERNDDEAKESGRGHLLFVVGPAVDVISGFATTWS